MMATHKTERAHGCEIYDRVALFAKPDYFALALDAPPASEGVEDIHSPKESDEREADDPVHEEQKVLRTAFSARFTHRG